MAENDSNAQEQQHSNGLGSNLPMMRRPAKASVEEKPVDIEASPTSEHVIPGSTMKNSITYFLRFSGVIESRFALVHRIFIMGKILTKTNLPSLLHMFFIMLSIHPHEFDNDETSRCETGPSQGSPETQAAVSAQQHADLFR